MQQFIWGSCVCVSVVVVVGAAYAMFESQFRGSACQNYNMAELQGGVSGGVWRPNPGFDPHSDQGPRRKEGLILQNGMSWKM